MSNIIIAGSDLIQAADGNLNQTLRSFGLQVFLPLSALAIIVAGWSGRIKAAMAIGAGAFFGATVLLGGTALWNTVATWGSGVLEWASKL